MLTLFEICMRVVSVRELQTIPTVVDPKRVIGKIVNGPITAIGRHGVKNLHGRMARVEYNHVQFWAANFRCDNRKTYVQIDQIVGVISLPLSLNTEFGNLYSRVYVQNISADIYYITHIYKRNVIWYEWKRNGYHSYAFAKTTYLWIPSWNIIASIAGCFYYEDCRNRGLEKRRDTQISVINFPFAKGYKPIDVVDCPRAEKKGVDLSDILAYFAKAPRIVPKDYAINLIF
jgi:hypothetical protein